MDLQDQAASIAGPLPTLHDAGARARRELFNAAARVLSWHARRTEESQRRWLAESGFDGTDADAQLNH